MGLIDVPPAKKRKATVTKEQMFGNVDQILHKATTNNPSAAVNGSVNSEITKASGNGSVTSSATTVRKAMAKACISEEAEEGLEYSDSEHEVDKNPKLKTLKKGKLLLCMTSVVLHRNSAYHLPARFTSE